MAGKLGAENDRQPVTYKGATINFEDLNGDKEKVYSALFNSANDGIFLIKNNRFIDCNPHVLKLFRCSRNDIVGKSPDKFSPISQPDGLLSVSSSKEKMERVKAGIPQMFEWVHKRLDNTTFYSEVTLSKLELENDDYILAIVRDVSERKHAENLKEGLYKISSAASRANNMKELFPNIDKALSTLFDTSNFFIALYNEKDDTIDVPYFKDEKDKIETFPAGKTLTAYVVKNNSPLLVTDDKVQEMIKQGLVEDYGTPSAIWLGVPLHAYGKVVGACVIQDYDDPKAFSKEDLDLLQFVSNQIGVTIEKQRAEDELRLNRMRLEEAQEIANLGSWHIQFKDKVLLSRTWSKEMKKIMDLSPTDTPPSDWIDRFVHHEDKAIIKEATKEALEKQSPFHLRIRIVNTASNKVKHVRLQGVASYDPITKICNITGTILDITEIIDANEQIELYSKELEETNKNKDRLLSIVAHDLKGPFNLLLGYTNMMASQFELFTEKELKEAIVTVNKSAKSAFILLENLLDWARIQSGKINYSPDNYSLLDLLRATIDLHMIYAQNKGISLVSEISTDISVYCDANMIGTVVRNLLSNAIKFTDIGGEIKITAQQKGTQTDIRVIDNGVGISKENLGKLFKIEDQYSTKGTSEETGTGLGLLLCKELVEKNNGTIEVKSKEGKGTEFIITIPSKG